MAQTTKDYEEKYNELVEQIRREAKLASELGNDEQSYYSDDKEMFNRGVMFAYISIMSKIIDLELGLESEKGDA